MQGVRGEVLGVRGNIFARQKPFDTDTDSDSDMATLRHSLEVGIWRKSKLIWRLPR